MLELCKFFKHGIDLDRASIIFQTGEIGTEWEQGQLCCIVVKVTISTHEEIKGQPYFRRQGSMDRLEDLGFKAGDGSVQKSGQAGARWWFEFHRPQPLVGKNLEGFGLWIRAGHSRAEPSDERLSVGERKLPHTKMEANLGFVIAHGALTPVHLAVKVGKHTNLVGHEGNHTARQIVAAARKPARKQESFEEKGKPEATRPCLVRKEDVLFLGKGPMLREFVRVPIALHAGAKERSFGNKSSLVGHGRLGNELAAICIEGKAFHPLRQLLARWLTIDPCCFERLMA